MKNAAFLLLAALGAVGCGSGPSAQDFEGLYRGSGSTVWSDDSGRSQTQSQPEWSESLSASVSSDKILFAGYCRLTGTVTGDRTFTLDPNDCDLGDGSADVGVTCHGRDRLKSGTGTLSDDGTSLTVTYVGEFAQTNCTDPSYNITLNYRSTAKLRRQ